MNIKKLFGLSEKSAISKTDKKTISLCNKIIKDIRKFKIKRGGMDTLVRSDVNQAVNILENAVKKLLEQEKQE